MTDSADDKKHRQTITRAIRTITEALNETIPEFFEDATSSRIGWQFHLVETSHGQQSVKGYILDLRLAIALDDEHICCVNAAAHHIISDWHDDEIPDQESENLH